MQVPIHQTYKTEQCKEAAEQHDRDILTQNTVSFFIQVYVHFLYTGQQPDYTSVFCNCHSLIWWQKLE